MENKIFEKVKKTKLGKGKIFKPETKNKKEIPEKNWKNIEKNKDKI